MVDHPTKEAAILFSPCISAKSWIITNGTTGEIIDSKESHFRREIASLTKLMTFYTVKEIAKRMDINIKETKIEISRIGSEIGGTSAELEFGDILSITDLLYGLLLPSGNDAAITLGKFFGEIILELSLSECENNEMVDGRTLVDIEISTLSLDPIDIFIKEMNKNCRKLKLRQTQFSNVHGLSDSNNRSCALDISRLVAICMSDRMFATIVRRKKWTAHGIDGEGNDKLWTWINTNKLLYKGYNGVKTGITHTAGSCLASSFITTKIWLIIVILGSKSLDFRFTETLKLTEYAIALLKRERKKNKLQRKKEKEKEKEKQGNLAETSNKFRINKKLDVKLKLGRKFIINSSNSSTSTPKKSWCYKGMQNFNLQRREIEKGLKKGNGIIGGSLEASVIKTIFPPINHSNI